LNGYFPPYADIIEVCVEAGNFSVLTLSLAES